MVRFTFILLSTLGLSLLLVMSLNLVVDPYDVGGPSISGINERRTRSQEDGSRIPVGHHLGIIEERTIVTGSSRVVDGFPDRSDTWPGGLYNAGIRGSNAFELAHVTALAGNAPNLRCVVIGLDLFEFEAGEKFKPAFPVSRLPDGNRILSRARVALSPNTLARSVQTIHDNQTGGSAFRFLDIYPAGTQRARFMNNSGTLRTAQTHVTDAERIEFLFASLEALSLSGVQIIGFMHPVHGFYEEAYFASGRMDAYQAFRQEMARRFEELPGEPVAPCIDSGPGSLWDFAGYQSIATTPPPGPQDTVTHRYFHEPAHYRVPVGQAILDRLTNGTQIDTQDFGYRLTTDNADATFDDILDRRRRFLDEDWADPARELSDLAQSMQANPPQSAPLTEADWKQLQRHIERIAGREQRLQAQ